MFWVACWDSHSSYPSCSSWSRVFASQITFSISTSENMPVSAHCASVRHDLPGIKFSSISVQDLHSLAFASISRWIYGHQIFCARDRIAKFQDAWSEYPLVQRLWLLWGLQSFRLYIDSHVSRLGPASRSWYLGWSLSICPHYCGEHNHVSSIWPVRIADSFLLTILFRVSLNLMSSAVSTTLVDGVVSVFDDVLVAGAVFEGELS